MYPTLYEINTRVWLNKFGKNIRISQIPEGYWNSLKDKGVDYVWLMGVWETTKSSIEKHCFHPDLMMAYSRVTRDWRQIDITGSPYAIEDYVIDTKVGTITELRDLKIQLNRIGLKLILDFIPNHFNADSKLLMENPEVFLEVSAEDFQRDPYTYFQQSGKYFAHGKDPYFPAWTDTVQIDYSRLPAHAFMLDKLLQVAEVCDGVRCDMAMLILPDIFNNTWSVNVNFNKELDFWSAAIAKVKSTRPDFVFMAEAYWDTEWRLHLLGFDYTYDKKLLDYIERDHIDRLKSHLTGSMEYHNQTVRFIENHDEERSLTSLGELKAKAAAILYNTIPGMRLHYEGQWSGERIRYPVQMGTYFNPDKCICAIRNSVDTQTIPCTCMAIFYDRLMEVCKASIFKSGTWSLKESYPDPNNCIVSQWCLEDQYVLAITNIGSQTNEIKTALPANWKDQKIQDLLNNEQSPNYVTVDDETISIRLPPYKGCILST